MTHTAWRMRVKFVYSAKEEKARRRVHFFLRIERAGKSYNKVNVSIIHFFKHRVCVYNVVLQCRK